MAPPKKIANDKVLSRRILVNVKRDQSLQTPVCIWAHEFPLLEEIHGDGNVQPVDVVGLDEGYTGKVSPTLMPFNKTQDKVRPPSETLGLGFVFHGDPEAEYERLVTVYGRMADVNIAVAEHVYGRFQRGDFARMIGEPTHADMPDAQLRRLLTDHGFLIETTSDSTDAEVLEAKAKRAELAAMSHDALVAAADELVGAYA